MPLFRRRRWEPPEPRCSFLVGCVSAELPPVDAVAHPEGSDGALHGSVIQQTATGPMRVGDTVLVAMPTGGTWQLEPLRVDAALRPEREIWPHVGLDDVLGERLSAARVDVRVQWLEGGEAPLAEDVLYGTRLADRLASLATGVVLDIAAFRAFGPAGWRVDDPVGELDPREHITIHSVGEDGGTWLHTHGLVKFARPDVEIYGVPDELVDGVAGRLNDLALYVMQGALVRPGETVGDVDAPLRAVESGRDREHWGDTVVLELVDADRGRDADRALRAWLDLQR